MTLIVHISDLHISKVNFDEDLFMMAVDEINHLSPEMIILTGDITDNGIIKNIFKLLNYYLFLKLHYLQYQGIMMLVI